MHNFVNTITNIIDNQVPTTQAPEDTASENRVTPTIILGCLAAAVLVWTGYMGIVQIKEYIVKKMRVTASNSSSPSYENTIRENTINNGQMVTRLSDNAEESEANPLPSHDDAEAGLPTYDQAIEILTINNRQGQDNGGFTSVDIQSISNPEGELQITTV